MVNVKIHGNLYHNEDCISGCRSHVMSESVDLIVTDPPYGIKGDKLHKHYNRDETFVVDGYVEVPAEEYGRFSRLWLKEAERILKPGGAIFIVSGYTNLYHILHALRESGLEEVNHIIWKFNFGVFTRMKFVSSHYHILYYEKPGKKRKRTFNLESRFGLEEKDEAGGSLNYQDREDVWQINREYKPGKVKNKNELPQELLVKMIQYASNDGDTVCDLFMGGFSTAKTAVGLGRRFVGFEISPEIFNHCVKDMETVRLGYLKPSLRVPPRDSLENRGKPWSEEDKARLLTRFQELTEKKKMTKGDAIEELSMEFGRGKWGIMKVLDVEME